MALAMEFARLPENSIRVGTPVIGYHVRSRLACGGYKQQFGGFFSRCLGVWFALCRVGPRDSLSTHPGVHSVIGSSSGSRVLGGMGWRRRVLIRCPLQGNRYQLRTTDRTGAPGGQAKTAQKGLPAQQVRWTLRFGRLRQR